MRRKWLSLRIDIATLDKTELTAELARIAGLMVSDITTQGKTMAPVYDSHGEFLGLWKIFEGEEAPAFEMTTPERR